MKLESLHIYPVKSAQGISIDEIEVQEIGFNNDRFFAVCNKNNEILTIREFPNLLKIETQITNNNLIITIENEAKEIPLTKELNDIELVLFKEPAYGKEIDAELNIWLSKKLDIECKLVKINSINLRETLNNQITFSDVSPIHLVSTASLNALNEKLAVKVELNRFRPNIVVSGINAFEENNIEKLIIGDCEFKTVLKTERCSLITVNSITMERDKNQEPLRTLVKDFRVGKKIEFGIYLAPIKTGVINIDDEVRVIFKEK